jgi:hypothetical protein
MTKLLYIGCEKIRDADASTKWKFYFRRDGNNPSDLEIVVKITISEQITQRSIHPNFDQPMEDIMFTYLIDYIGSKKEVPQSEFFLTETMIEMIDFSKMKEEEKFRNKYIDIYLSLEFVEP